MNRRDLKKIFLGVLVLVAMIVAYNIWSYASGRCTITMLLSLSPTIKVLFAANLIAAVGLVLLKRLRKQRERSRYCRCGTKTAGTDWNFCPVCGAEVISVSGQAPKDTQSWTAAHQRTGR